MRQPLSEIRILLPAWGKRYIEQFLDFCLPTLLADGNLPALRRRSACTFVLLARAEEIETLESNPFWQALQRLCAVETIDIDDLISASHSTTLTLAYARGIRSCKSPLPEACFVFLVADYVFADGALDNALARIVTGASGVLVGNFQVTSREVAPVLLQARADKPCLSIKPQDLMRLALAHLHPATLANFPDTPASHDASSNRLFWRVDDSTLVGRFYLMHMIAIRPETAEFLIAAPSDYSLIAELCPSGAVAVLEDSDEYCVVELQPQRPAGPNIRLGPMTPAALAASLRGWATRRHRENARSAVVFHSRDPGPALAETIARSRRFIDEVERRLPAAAQPFRYHPYWYGAIDHHERTSSAPVDFAALSELLGDVNFATTIKSARSSRLRAALLGRAPDFRPWHPRWPDARGLWGALGGISQGASVVVVGDLPARLRDAISLWLMASGARRVSHTALRQIDRLADLIAANPQDRFDVCVLLLSQENRGDGWPKVEQSNCLVRPAGRILLVVGDIFEEDLGSFDPGELSRLPISAPSGLRLEDFHVVPAGRARLRTQSLMMDFARSSVGDGLGRRLLSAAGAAALAAVSLGLNLGAILRSNACGRGGCSSVFLTLRLGPPEIHEIASKPVDGRAPSSQSLEEAQLFVCKPPHRMPEP